MLQLTNIYAAVFAVDGFEETELTEPVKALRDAGAKVDIISVKPGKIQGFKHHDKSITVEVDRTLDEVDPKQYDMLVLPGGALNADAARIQPKVQEFVRSFDKDKKPLAVICHAPWLLVSSGLVKDRTLTSYKTIQDDIKNAGGKWVDQEVVVDKNWVTSRQPSDIPAFNREMIKMLAECLAKSKRTQAA